MRTNDLIRALAADTATRMLNPSRALARALPVAFILAGILFIIFLGPRTDIAAALGTWRFQIKLAFTTLLLFSTIPALLELTRPTPVRWRSLAPLLIAPLLISGASVIEMKLTPADAWMARAVGSNSLVCLTIVPTLALTPLAVIFYALRNSAPAAPALTGAVAGIMAGAISATYYATLCTDDSPFFVGTWYTIAIAALAIASAFAGRYLLRW